MRSSPLEPLSLARVAACLTGRGLVFATGPGERLLVAFAGSRGRPEVRCRITAGDQVLALTADTPVLLQAGEVPALLGAVNGWHRKHRWPTLHVHLDPAQDTAALHAEQHTLLRPGVTDEQLQSHLDLGLALLLHALTSLTPPPPPHGVPTPTDAELDRWYRL